MLKSIGFRRLLFLGVLIAVSGALAAAVYFYFLPLRIKVDRDLRIVSSEVSKLRADIGKLQVDLADFDAQKDVYDLINSRGFLEDQDRRYAEDFFKEAKNRKNLVSIEAGIKGGVIEENATATEAGYRVLNSPITVIIQAVDDAVIHRFLHEMQYSFKGHISVDNLYVRRAGDVTGPILRAIANRSKPKLVECRIELSWRSLIPESDVLSSKEDVR